MIRTYANRYDPNYLKFLSKNLEPENLIATAVVAPRHELWKDYQSKKTNKIKELKKAVKIDFCGIACTTLLGTNRDKQEADIKVNYPDKYAEIVRLKEEVKKKFLHLFTDESVELFNTSGVYLKVRFCFPYLYSEFPLSIMRAEDSSIWKAALDHEVSFSGNAPVNSEEWADSNMYKSQIASLHEIVGICKRHPSFCITEDFPKVTNTMETRFAVIPIPSSVLMINNLIISDSYLYSKVADQQHLSINTPINVIDRYPSDMAMKAKKEDIGFRMLRQNFIYLWRHDLSLHADMATSFSQKSPEGLLKIKPPVKPGKRNIPNIDWQIKIERIKERKHELDKNYNPDDPSEKKMIAAFKSNLISKMELCSRSIPVKMNSAKLFVNIGHEKAKFYVKLTYMKNGLKSTLFEFHKK